MNTLRIFDGRLVGDHVRRGPRVALDDVQRVAVEVAGPIEPGLIVEPGHVDDKRVAVPAADRLPHPRIDRRRSRILQIDIARRAIVFVGDEDRVRALENLKGIGHVGRARHARQVALDFGIRSSQCS